MFEHIGDAVVIADGFAHVGHGSDDDGGVIVVVAVFFEIDFFAIGIFEM